MLHMHCMHSMHSRLNVQQRCQAQTVSKLTHKLTSDKVVSRPLSESQNT